MNRSFPVTDPGAAPETKKAGGGACRGALARGPAALLLWTLCLPGVFALDPSRDVRQYILDTWGLEKGLPQLSVQQMAQDRSGYLWVGTQNGIACFSGTDFRVYDSRNTPPIEEDSFYALGIDAKDRVWAWPNVAPLVRIERPRVERVGVPGLLPSLTTVVCFATGGDGSVWFGSNTGLFRFRDAEPPLRLGLQDGLPSNDIASLCVDAGGVLWIGTRGNGLATFRGGKLAPVDGGASPRSVQALWAAPDGRVLAGSEAGVTVFKSGREVSTRPGPWPDGSRVTCLREDRDGNLWAGTDNAGLYRIREGRADRLSKTEGLPVNGICCLLEDREGALWVGTNGGGLVRLRDGLFTPVTHRIGLGDDFCWMVCPGEGGAVWIGTNSGLFGYSGHAVRNLGREHGVPEVAVRAGFREAGGRFWFGGRGLLGHTDGKTFTLYGEKDGVPGDSTLSAVARDDQGNVWVGTIGRGLYRLRDGRLEPIRMPGVPAGANVRAIVPGPDGSLWFGIFGVGLGVLSGGRWTLFDQRDGLRNLGVLAVCVRPDGTVWFGAGGLHRYRGGKFTSLDRKLEMPDKHLVQVLDDGVGYAWICNLKGITRVSWDDLDALADGKVPGARVRVFGLWDGLPSAECNGANQSAGCRTPDGKLWFPTTGGAAFVDPRAVMAVPAPPRVRIDECRVDDRTVDPRDPGLEFPPGTAHLDIGFTSLYFTAPERVRFRYRLEGLDTGWREGTGLRNAVYTNLSPGAYTFRVTACNADGAWNPDEAVLSFEIRPFFYQTAWFRWSLFILAVVGVNFLLRGGRKLVETLRYWRRNHYFAHFRILEQIGRGGAGNVYRARDSRNGRLVALKIIHREAADPAAIRRLATEGRISGTIRHPNIVEILEQGDYAGRLYFAMEFVEGVTLRDIMNRRRLPVAHSMELFRILLGVIEDLHRSGIAHRDLKPENIMVKSTFPWGEDLSPAAVREGLGGALRVLDFGTARFIDSRTLTRTGQFEGTLYYLPPEFFLGQRVSGTEQDYYALGIILYELLGGRRPFAAQDDTDLIAAILHDPLPPPGAFQFDVPAPLSDLVLGLIDRNPQRRLKSFVAIRERLDALPAGPGASRPAPDGDAPAS